MTQAGRYPILSKNRFGYVLLRYKNGIEFYCGGAGFGPSTSYVGFYYTGENDMRAVWCAPPAEELLIPEGDGFLWEERRGDDRYYTEQICDNFYYYEASF